MRTISYTAKERRAANQVWNAAERYNFDPLFLAVETGDLDSDLYMNLIIGLAYQYYGEKTISTLFGYWNGDISQAMLDDLTWLYLEHVLYTEEALKRPSMTDLRVYYGKAFFAGDLVSAEPSFSLTHCSIWLTAYYIQAGFCSSTPA